MTRRIVIVGEAPSQHSDPKLPFSGASGRTLAKLAGLDGYEELAREATLLNVLQKWPGPGNAGEKGSRFPMKKARRAAAKILGELRPRDFVIFAGKRVAAAFGIRFSDFFLGRIIVLPPPRAPATSGDLHVAWITCMPHPSGCNRYWNYPENREGVSAWFRREVFPETPARVLARGMKRAA